MTDLVKRETSFSLRPSNLQEAMKFSEIIANSDMVPKDFRGKPGNVLVAVQYGAELGLAPMQALQNISVINGKPSVWGDALLAIVRGSQLCEDVAERIEGDGDNAVAICVAKRRGASPVEGRFSVADAKKAQLWGKQGPWMQYPKRMLQMRARGFALRDAFPDLLRGIITAEEALDHPAEGLKIVRAAVQSVQSGETKTAQLRAQFDEPQEAAADDIEAMLAGIELAESHAEINAILSQARTLQGDERKRVFAACREKASTIAAPVAAAK